jgi:hypothetical protein
MLIVVCVSRNYIIIIIIIIITTSLYTAAKQGLLSFGVEPSFLPVCFPGIQTLK